MRILFIGTPKFAVPTLECLVQNGHEIVAVYTQPDKPSGRGRGLDFPAVKTTALAHGLPLLQPPSLKQEAERAASLQPDVIVVAAFGQLLPQRILDIPPFGCLNIHPSLLPRHRGPSPVAAAILSGDEVTGVSIMLMDKGLDTGPILAQEQVPISPQDTTDSLNDKLAQVGARLFLQTLPDWVEGKLTPKLQVEEKVTYSRTLTKEEGEMDWHFPAVELERMVRAFQPWPGCYTRWQGKLLKIIEGMPLDEPQSAKVGQVISIKQPQRSLIGVQTGEGILQLLKVQLEGKKVMTVEEFQRGQKGFIGVSLPC